MTAQTSVPSTAHREFGSRKVRTRIHRMGDAFTWRRTREHRSLVDSPGELIPAQTEDAARLVAGVRAGNTFTYRLPGDTTLGEDLARAWRSGQAGPVARYFAAAGATLHALATSSEFHQELPPPLGACQILSRLRRPDSGTSGESRGHARLRTQLFTIAGTARARTLEAWAGELIEEPRRPGLLHGEYSVSAMVPAQDRRQLAVLFGETVSRGAIEYDAGWLLGELAEWSDVSRAEGGATALPLGSLASSFLRPLPDLDFDLLGRVVVLRRLMHVIDYVSAFGWSDLVNPYVALLPELVDSHGMSTLSRIGWEEDVAARLPSM
ncbi:hypothetical protein BKI49_09975 [Streptomyces sp. Tue6028]|nr:hypothetical protein BKI49_09975 [Streptomyces sp. Tue6028]